MDNTLDLIREGILELNAKGSKTGDLMIAFSPLVERHLIMVIHNSQWSYTPNLEMLTRFEGVSIYNRHPYNEIVVYDTTRSYLSDDFIYKIELIKIQGTIV